MNQYALLRQFCSKPVLQLPEGCEVVHAVNIAASLFSQHQIPEPRLSAEHLCAHALGLKYGRPALLRILRQRHQEGLKFSRIERSDFLRSCQRRLTREPVQYIVGGWDFLDFHLNVRSPVLIPRPETEELVCRIIETQKRAAARTLRFLEIGCGSGVISIALLRSFPTSTCTAIDISTDAIQLSQENAVMNHVDDRLDLKLADVRQITSIVSSLPK
eukprot:TRINITY_DN18685_c1_g1::TRINITY_DN18685_c1_g1_i1::g.20378::m.20378 TRINITY_DN18685_c1_g1::TRINITY_DN18685_c1_g1_i1::g.20378  ORF type:complete len:216 (+),score=-7.68,sp/Q921L7/HEMK1_MOUSE/36.22/1e-22,Methyltransf_18/PF12847.2/3.6e+03,Methyltransf_18/PF12847.2/3.1e-10,MTS/PF05175.9/2.7e-10,PrmA/PF06325.8/5.1e-10,Methyltransf_31/PF13847.1/2.2e-08,Methyltransf_26/PF13659.1/4.3e+02,Methyltransf_26/PF13659.1/4.8e-07,Methyltransf_12/PF08242.7/2.6e-06,Methyltransf_11/PF08241.7/1.9e+03,Methyltransf_11/P